VTLSWFGPRNASVAKISASTVQYEKALSFFIWQGVSNGPAKTTAFGGRQTADMI